MATHTDLPIVRAGWIGVDIFFVLSGFLITTLLLQEFARNRRVSLARFYARRVLRLYPALLVVLAAVTCYALLGAPLSIRSPLLAEAAWSSVYLTNLAWPQDVFLGHTWTLALEEQFYLVWPPVLLLLLHARARARILLAQLFALCVLITVAETAGRFGPAGILDQRPDALLVGCAGAIARFFRHRLWPTSPLVVVVAGTSGALFLTCAGTFLGSGVSGVGSILVALAALAVISLAIEQPTALPSRILGLRPLVWIGRISYGLYLWHLPIFRWVAARDLTWPDPWIVLLKVSATFLAATASWLLVERHLLRLKPYAPVAQASTIDSAMALDRLTLPSESDR
jgi:peptidoglycan/LPS O-acetylase OafA/YrhL